MSLPTRRYPAKLLLFGEYLLLQGATALALPIPGFGGQWRQKDAHESPENWQKLSAFAQQLPDDWSEIDVKQLREAVAAGWYFDSNIPQGYGLGSSGALCAALYEQFATARHDTIPDIQAALARLESRFHGRSSGIDPLTSLLDRPLLIQGDARPFDAAPWPDGKAPVIFLIDTQQARQTGPLVQWFMAESQREPLAELLKQAILPAHEAMVSAWLNADESFWQHLAAISRWQLNYFKPMLPANRALTDLWTALLEQPGNNLKICGAGGGGFVLGFTNQPEHLLPRLTAAGFDPILPFHA